MDAIGRLLVLGLVGASTALVPVRSACAQAPIVFVFDSAVPSGPETHFFIPFEVPTGIVEIEVRHDDLSATDILDWGLEDPSGFRGWGGGNVEPAVVAIDRASRSYVPGPIGTGTWRVVVGKAKVVSSPAQYHVEVELRFASTLPAQPTRAPYVEAPPLRSTAGWYAGDFHVHSTESGDASASLDAIATLATSRGLDFVAISDHNTHTALDFFADVRTRFPSLLLVPSVEFTTYAGHASVPGALAWVDHRIGVEGATIADAVAAYHAQGAVFSLNHPEYALGDLCIGCAWEHSLEADSVDAVEIMTTSLDIVQTLYLEPTIARWDAMSDQGAHIAALGGSDDHRAGAGDGALDGVIGDPTTLVYADELSVAGILEGIRRGRTVVKIRGPDSPMVVLDANAPLDGDTVRGRRVTLQTDVTGGDGTTLLYFRNGVPLDDVVVVDSETFHHELRVAAPSVGEDRYRAEVYDAMGRMTVTSHLYVTRTGANATSTGCSCALAVGSGSPDRAPAIGSIAVLLGLAATRARRLRSRARTRCARRTAGA